jgi:hypothetical protein
MNIHRLLFNVGPAPIKRWLLHRAELDNPQSLPDQLILEATTSSDPTVRLAALECFFGTADKISLDHLRTAVQDPYPAIRAAGVNLLGLRRRTREAWLVSDRARDEDAEVRAQAASSLGEFPGLDSNEVLMELLADTNPEVRIQSAIALSRVGGPLARPALETLVKDDIHQRVRREAAAAILAINQRTAPLKQQKRATGLTLIDLLADPRKSWQQRMQAKQALLRLNETTLLPEIYAKMDATDDVSVHLHLVEVAIALPPGSELQALLVGCLHHIADSVRRKAIIALGDVGDMHAVQHLEQTFLDEVQTSSGARHDFRLAQSSIQKIWQRVAQGRHSGP